MLLELGGAASRPARRMKFETPTCGLPPMPRAAEPVERAPELARRVDVAQERAQHALATTSTFVRLGQPLAVERPRARAARGISGSSTIVDQRRRDRRPLAAGEVARLAPDRAARHHARELARAARAPPRARRPPAPRRSGSCARPAWRPCGAPPRGRPPRRSASAAGEARRGPVGAVALLAVGVVAQRLDHERHVRAA